MTMRHVDVVMATDLRLPGGTAQSVAAEARAQHAAGLSTGLVAIESPLAKTANALAPAIQALLDDGIASLIDREAHVHCDVAIVRHPKVAEALDVSLLPRVQAETQAMIVNQALSVPVSMRRRDANTTRFDVSRAKQNLSDWLGAEPTWWPISPLVRDDMRNAAADVALADTDWVNIIDPERWRVPRTLGRHAVPVIGRHSRDDILKWPQKKDLFRVYPTDASVEVAVLGGIDALVRLNGYVPRLWRTYPFSSVPVKAFLGSLDLYVYFHHPAWVEAFGRTILEALASGLPTVLDRAFEPLFGNAAVYTDVDGVADTIGLLTASSAAYNTQVEAGVLAVNERFSYAAHTARLETLMGRTFTPATKQPELDKPAQNKRRVLFVSSNGAGVGHLMRLMAYAKHAPEAIEPVFLTLSQGVQVVDDAGYFVEYLPSRQVTGAPARDWHPVLRERLLELIDRYDVTAVVFDGTWPYQGLLDALILSPHVRFVWSRRALWKPNIKNPFLRDRRGLVDLVLEPGDAADDHDRGPTVARRREATRVSNVRFVEDDAMLEPAAARAELGIAPNVTAVLVHLGAGNINDTSDVLGALVARLVQEPNTDVYVTRSIIAKDAGGTFAHVHPLSVYPLAKYLKAFDYAFAASGYNSFHELLAANVPTGWVANTDTATDDQAARARYAAHVGIGRDVTDATVTSIDAAVTVLSCEASRERMRLRMRLRQQPNGAHDAMQAIASLLDTTPRARAHALDDPLGPRATGLGALLPPKLRSGIDTVRLLARPATYRRLVARRLRRVRARVRQPLVAFTPAQYRSRVAAALGLSMAVALPLTPNPHAPRRVMVVFDEQRPADDVDVLVDALAATAAQQQLAVLIVLRVPAFRVVRQHGLVAEYLPSTDRFGRAHGKDTPATMLARRLATCVARYGITDTVHIQAADTPKDVCSQL
ncbi:MAG: hypothetical protein WD360_00240 [Nitriliruptoraceae bacterium]